MRGVSKRIGLLASLCVCFALLLAGCQKEHVNKKESGIEMSDLDGGEDDIPDKVSV